MSFIRLDECPGLSESSLGENAILCLVVLRLFKMHGHTYMFVVVVAAVVVLLFYVQGKHLWSCRDGIYVCTDIRTRLRQEHR